MNAPFSKYLYIGFLLLGLYQAIFSKDYVQAAASLGIGLVGRMPSGPGIITDELIHSIAKTVLPPIDTFLLTSETTAEAIIAHHNKVNTTTIQMVDALTGREYHKIREAIPHVKLVQVIHVLDEKAVQEAIEISEWVDAILLDSGNPNLSTKVLGGTGKTHNWDLSKKIRENISIPTYLAGGINKDNIRNAIEHVQPSFIDLCSSVRTNGQLDERKLEELFKALL